VTRFDGIVRDWTEEDVQRIRGPFKIEYTIANLMSSRLWNLMNTPNGVRTLGASTPAQAVQMVQAGLKGIYLSGWQVAADVNGHMYPDQSLYPADCVPKLAKAINNALLRQSKIAHSNGGYGNEQVQPIVADGEAGFGGALNVFELTKRMIEAGVAGVHYEDQLSSEKKCGHLGGKVLVPARTFIGKLKAARLAADVCGVDTVIIARTDANSAKLITSDWDYEHDEQFIIQNRMSSRVGSEGFWEIPGGLEMAIVRGLAYAPYADALWCETSTPDLGEAREFAEAIHERFPGKLLAYNCSPSFNWSEHLEPKDIASFQDKLNEMGYKFQFITLAGFHSLNDAMWNLATDYKERGMAAYAQLQNYEFMTHKVGYKAVKHQAFVGTGYFDTVRGLIDKESSTGAMAESTEAEQF
jgi:isocitrate lyase